jgi:hypothetical protein
VVQVDPVKHKLKPPGTKRLKLKCDMLLSTFAFNHNLCRYSMAKRNADFIAVGTASKRCPATSSLVQRITDAPPVSRVKQHHMTRRIILHAGPTALLAEEVG